MNPVPSNKFIVKMCSMKMSSLNNEIFIKYLNEEGAG
jgi:hypothetical protein